MGRSRAVMIAGACLVLALCAAPAWGKPVFHPRVRNALGLVPPANSQGRFAAQADVASGAPTPLTYHGGSVMAGGITMHLVFWTGGTNPFQGKPSGAPADYVGMIERLYTDVAHDSLAPPTSSVSCRSSRRARRPVRSPPASTASRSTARAATTSSWTTIRIRRWPTSAPPRTTPRCASLTARCSTSSTGSSQATAGHAACTTSGWCSCRPASTNASCPACAGPTRSVGTTRSVDVGHGPTIYSVAVDPIIGGEVVAWGGPPGLPGRGGDAGRRRARDGRGHDRPGGPGLDGPQRLRGRRQVRGRPPAGDPARFAADGSPFNQVVDGHRCLFQEMWSNDDNACVQRTSLTSNPLPLPQVNFTQFSPWSATTSSPALRAWV